MGEGGVQTLPRTSTQNPTLGKRKIFRSTTMAFFGLHFRSLCSFRLVLQLACEGQAPAFQEKGSLSGTGGGVQARTGHSSREGTINFSLHAEMAKGSRRSVCLHKLLAH